MKLKSFYLIFLLSVLIPHSASRFRSQKTEARTIHESDLWEYKSGCRIGVPIEYWFNDTVSRSNSHLPSSPGCPKSGPGIRWIYYKEHTSCFLAGYQGPCKNGYVLKARTNSYFGKCSCDCKNNGNRNIRYVSCGMDFNEKTRIYDKQAKRCYLNETEGTGQPCGKKQVIIGFTDKSIKCALNCRKLRKSENDKRCVSVKLLACPVSGTFSAERAQCPVGTSWKEGPQRCTKDITLPF